MTNGTEIIPPTTAAETIRKALSRSTYLGTSSIYAARLRRDALEALDSLTADAERPERAGGAFLLGLAAGLAIGLLRRRR